MKTIAVIGCGIWGKNVVRNFYNLNALHTVCDLDEENRRNLKEIYPDVNFTDNADEVLANPEIDAVAVVTPSHTLYKIVKKAIEAGVISNRGNFLYYKEDNSPLCSNGEEPTLNIAAKFLNLPKNQELKFSIEAKIKE